MGRMQRLSMCVKLKGLDLASGWVFELKSEALGAVLRQSSSPKTYQVVPPLCDWCIDWQESYFSEL